jgi:hypothetical protein
LMLVVVAAIWGRHRFSRRGRTAANARDQ